MPPEKRRQRQQRVRHEAGDYVPSKNENLNNEINKEKQQSYAVEADNQANNDSLSKDSNKKKPNNNRPKEKGTLKEGQVTHPRKNERSRCENSNVAFAEEREYEAVTIMESKTDKLKGVAELPQPTKYRRSEVISNWLCYEELPCDDEPEEGEDYLLGEDFSQVLDSNVNKIAGGFLQLKGEMSWGKLGHSQIGNHGLGALKMTDLVSALSTIPLPEQLKIPETSLPGFTVSCYKSSAEKILKDYKPNQEYVTDIEINQKTLDSLKLSETEPLRLSSQELEYHKASSGSEDATLKFSSAFKPESTDVDLDSFIKENTPEYGPSVRVTVEEVIRDDENQKRERENQVVLGVKREPSDVKTQQTQNKSPTPNSDFKPDEIVKDLKSNKAKLKETPPPQTSSVKEGFNFGLQTRADNLKSNGKKKNVVKPTKEKKEELDSKNLKIDLDKPVLKEKGAPVLINKSEVENLEDWLDSVLDD